ncbi:hypothetical protein [Syntrophorhabdus aromaticivorans]|uniref:hypothetical protein n=1 Tax=Syntrophorhabdus aromaticivorans TaxID=328301 RepID=UPI0018DDFACC|nr:hypothetical protein [Syntrophorhabdus aromaticivorans]
MIIACLSNIRKVAAETEMAGNRVAVTLGALEAQVPALPEAMLSMVYGYGYGYN